MVLSKTGRFLSKAEILGVGVFSPLSIALIKNACLLTEITAHAPPQITGGFFVASVVTTRKLADASQVATFWSDNSFGFQASGQS